MSTIALRCKMQGSRLETCAEVQMPNSYDLSGIEAVATMITNSLMKRLGSAAEVAHLVTWLYTDTSRFNTGAVFAMSGGLARY